MRRLRYSRDGYEWVIDYLWTSEGFSSLVRGYWNGLYRREDIIDALKVAFEGHSWRGWIGCETVQFRGKSWGIDVYQGAANIAACTFWTIADREIERLAPTQLELFGDLA